MFSRKGLAASLIVALCVGLVCLVGCESDQQKAAKAASETLTGIAQQAEVAGKEAAENPQAGEPATLIVFDRKVEERVSCNFFKGSESGVFKGIDGHIIIQPAPDWMQGDPFSIGVGQYTGLKKGKNVYLAAVCGWGHREESIYLDLNLGDPIEVKSTAVAALRDAVPNITDGSYQGVCSEKLTAPSLEKAREILKRRGESGFILEKGVNPGQMWIYSQKISGGRVSAAEYAATLKVQSTGEVVYRYKAATGEWTTEQGTRRYSGWTHLNGWWDTEAAPGSIERIPIEAIGGKSDEKPAFVLNSEVHWAGYVGPVTQFTSRSGYWVLTLTGVGKSEPSFPSGGRQRTCQ